MAPNLSNNKPNLRTNDTNQIIERGSRGSVAARRAEGERERRSFVEEISDSQSTWEESVALIFRSV
ncbi:hypothetical protein AMTR_s00052p00077010 [Amborella trichopoda]|uniref:Uncharacterized protein n=1 Tax=Amborella trichopoda TaxID=13333 RepID=U5D7M2_AMBTC|nr:hypothetical protein AMTR_s00052p00077010 [Amborella trichopoda]